jgi:AAA15 family ATPase/GTPase
MKIKSISFKNYKAFFERQTIELKPITILIGKNSSGKSSIAKLFTLIENSLSGDIEEPLLLKNSGVELGDDFDNLFFKNNPGGIPLNFIVTFENDVSLEVDLLKKEEGYGLEILRWKYQDALQTFDLELSNNEYMNMIDGKRYACKFKGFIPVKLVNVNNNVNLAGRLNFQKIDVDYIGPFRVLPQRYFYLTGQENFQDTGITGENAYAMLGISKLKKDDELYKDVGKWYKDNFDGWELKVDDRSKKPLIQISLSKNDIEVNIVDVGQGMNQALPLVVRANVTDKNGSMIIVEQPELHLHPAAHSDLAELFARSAKKNNQIFIVETHSENMLLRFRRLIIENDFDFTKDDIVIYWIEDAELKGQELMKITIDEDGDFSDWRDGVFEEALKEVLEIQRALNKKDQNR